MAVDSLVKQGITLPLSFSPTRHAPDSNRGRLVPAAIILCLLSSKVNDDLSRWPKNSVRYIRARLAADVFRKHAPLACKHPLGNFKHSGRYKNVVDTMWPTSKTVQFHTYNHNLYTWLHDAPCWERRRTEIDRPLHHDNLSPQAPSHNGFDRRGHSFACSVTGS